MTNMRNAMKSRMFLTLCSTWVLALLKPVPGVAQAEIDPDHFYSRYAPTMTGMLCSSTCVSQNPGHATCSQNCADKSGEIVLIDDQDRVLKIANQESVKEHAGKKVNMRCRPAAGT